MLSFVPDNVPNNVENRKRKPLISKSGFPYLPAEISPKDYDLSKPWYITFYPFNPATGKLQRKRILKEELRSIPSLAARIQYALNAANNINSMLAEDFIIEAPAETEIEAYDFSTFSLVQGFNFVIQVKHAQRVNTSNYKSTLSSVEDFLVYNHLKALHGNDLSSLEEYERYAFVRIHSEREKLHKSIKNGFQLKAINTVFVQRYVEYLQSVRKLENKTINNHIGYLHSVVEVLMKHDEKLFKKNPFANFHALPTDTKKHAAYSDAQMNSIIDELTRDGKHHVVLFIRFMFYTLARPEEIRQLKVGHIRLEERRILFLAENAKTNIEQYVGISDRFYQIIVDSGIMHYPAEHYIFSYTSKGNIFCYQPYSIRLKKKYFYDYVTPVIERLGFYEINQNYTLYSFKHSGAISLYQATRDIKLLQDQLRHTTIEQTDRYLRDLGLFRDMSALNKWNAI